MFDQSSQSGYTDAAVKIDCELQRETLADGAQWIVDFQEQGLREGIRGEELDEAADQLADARALQERLRQDAGLVAVPMSLVADLIKSCAEYLERWAAGIAEGEDEPESAIGRMVDLLSVMVQLQEIAPAIV